MSLAQQTFIVTGAAAGMGAHFTQRLLELGANVAAGDVDEGGLARLASSADGPGRIFTRRLDVSDEASCSSFVAEAQATLGALNGLVNNAGILRDGLLVKKERATGEVKKLSLEQLRAVLDVNLVGATLMVRETVAAMASTGSRGVVVNLSSLSRHGNRGQTNYVAAKAALAANTVTWAREFAPLGVRVVAIAPGMVETPMTANMNDKAREALVAQIPVGRIGTPEDLWLALRFCLECTYFNGRCLDVDGGLTM